MEGGCTGTKYSDSGRNWKPTGNQCSCLSLPTSMSSASSSPPPSVPIPLLPEAQESVIYTCLGVSATFSLSPNWWPLMAHWCPHCHLQLTCEQLHLPACCHCPDAMCSFCSRPRAYARCLCPNSGDAASSCSQANRGVNEAWATGIFFY